MGTVVVKVDIANPLEPAHRASLEVLVDTGALYSMVPGNLLHQLGVEPLARRAFRTADGRSMERPLADVLLFYDGEQGATRVIFGEPSDVAVLGLHALETLGLEVDPVNKKLRPTTLFLYAAKAKTNLTVACPHCGSKLVVDSVLGAVLDHEPPPKQPAIADLSEAAKGLQEEARKREEKFAEEFAAQKTRSDVLAKKFEEQFKKAKDQPVSKPLRDFDLD